MFNRFTLWHLLLELSTWSQVSRWGTHGKMKYLCVFFFAHRSVFSRKASPVIWYVVVYWCLLVIENTSKGTRSQSYESCKIFWFNWIDLYVIEFTEFLFSYNFWFLMWDIEWEMEKKKIYIYIEAKQTTSKMKMKNLWKMSFQRDFHERVFLVKNRLWRRI